MLDLFFFFTLDEHSENRLLHAIGEDQVPGVRLRSAWPVQWEAELVLDLGLLGVNLVVGPLPRVS